MALGCSLNEQAQGLVAGYATVARRLAVEITAGFSKAGQH